MSDVSFACLDWFDRLQNGLTPIPDLPIEPARYKIALDCIDQLRIPDIAGQPTFADVGGDWFRDIIKAFYGCVDPETGEDLVGEVFLLIPKKNAKTTNAALLGVTALLINEIPNAEMQIVAATQKISNTCFRQAQGMIKADKKLSEILQVQEHLKRIKHVVSGAFLEVKTFDMNVVTGSIPAVTIVDELHLLSSKSYAKAVIGQIRGGMITNPKSKLFFITTQSAEEPAGVFKTELEYARAVRDGKIKSKTRMLPVLYEFPEAVQMDEAQPWLNPEMWQMVLPNLGRSITIERLIVEMETEREKGEENLSLWFSQHLNIQIGIGLHNDRWIGVDYWLSSQDDEMTLDSIIDSSEVCVVGIDGGGLDDLLGLTVIGRHRETKVWQSWSKVWADDEVARRRKKIAERLQDFEKQGDLVFCQNGTDDVQEVAEICQRLNEEGLLPKDDAIGLDPEGVAAILDELTELEITDEQMAAISQGYRLNAAIKGTPRKLKNGTMKHCAQPMMTWCVSNAKTESRGNAQVVTKAVSGTGKIDPVMAMFNAVMLMSRNPVAAVPEKSPWEDADYRMSA